MKKYLAPVSVAAVIAALLLAILPFSKAQVTDDAAAVLMSEQFFREKLVPLGDFAPSSEESQALLTILRQVQVVGFAVGLPAVEEFLAANPNSAWSASLHANLALHYRSRGQVTPAMTHWVEALIRTKDVPSGPGKHLADLTLAHWSRLLMAMGRTEDLIEVYKVYGDRVLDRGPLTQMWLRTHEKHLRMLKYPHDSYKCGIYALDQVAQALGIDTYSRSSLINTPGKPEGFSLRELQAIALSHGIPMKSVRRADGNESLPVPSVVHWQQGHFGAILTRSGDFYRVADPSGGASGWLTADEINSEATGHFLIPSSNFQSEFRQITGNEAEAIIGRASSCPPEDSEDFPCDGCGEVCPPGSGTGGMGGGGGGRGGRGGRGGNRSLPRDGRGGSGSLPCTDCYRAQGMPAWRVSEPYLNLWIHDVPLFYQPAKGPAMEFSLTYRQRDETDVSSLNGSKVGLGWNASWLSSALNSGGTVFLPGGGTLTFEYSGGSSMSLPAYRNNRKLETLTSGGSTVGYVMHLADGSQYKYAHAGTYVFHLSDIIEPSGNKLTFSYSGELLSTVTDADGNVTTVYYDDSNLPSYITRIVAPGNREVLLDYDADGMLIGVVDVVGISSSFTYDSYTGWASSMTTPYGTTSFTMNYGVSGYDRSVIVTQPDGSHHCFMLVDAYTGTDMPSGYQSSQLPTGTPFAITGYPYGTLDVSNRRDRNSFYWNAQQFAALSTTNLSSFTWSEFKRARIRHWLWKVTPDSYNHVDTLGHEQAPSPDGSTEGQIIWFDCANDQFVRGKVA